jgi:hypothetical protein
VTHEEAVSTLAAERYLLNEMTERDRLTFEEHFFDCEVCADEMRSAAAMLQGAKAGFAGTMTTTSKPATAAAPPAATTTAKPSGRVVPMVPKMPSSRPVWYRTAALPWAAAATLAVITGYQSLWVVPALRRDSTPTAIVPVTVRPASRGAEAVVPLGSENSPARAVALALELADAPQGSELTYDLRRADGSEAGTGRVAAPLPGTPLLFFIPSSTLVGSMHYILIVHDAGPSNRVLGEYRFAVSRTQ